MTTETPEFEFFWKSKSIFSNHYICHFHVNNQVFTSVEQYMMYQKALLFGDKVIASKVLATQDCNEQKKLGRLVKGFDNRRWEFVRERIVYDGLKAKFTQNPSLLSVIKSKKGKIFVEASPFDTIWGIGLPEDHPDAKISSKWRGMNLLGKLLTKLANVL